MTTAELASFIDNHDWRFASSMARFPHWYTLRKNARSDEDFVKFVEFIRTHGYDDKFFTMKLRYLDIGEYKYWTMGCVMQSTILINRAKLDRPPNAHAVNPVEFYAKPDPPGKQAEWQPARKIFKATQLPLL